MAKQDAKGPASSGPTGGSRRRKASRPPVIDLEAVEVSSKKTGAGGSAPKAARSAPAERTAAQSARSEQPDQSRPQAGKPADKGTPPPGKVGHGPTPPEPSASKPAGINQLMLAAGAGALIFLIAVLVVRFTGQDPRSADKTLSASLDRLAAKIDQLEKNAPPSAVTEPQSAASQAIQIAASARAEARAAQDRANAASRQTTDLIARVDKLAKASAAAPDSGQIAGLSGRLKTLEASSAVLSRDLAAALSRQSDLETALTSAKGAGGRVPAALALRLKNQATTLARLERRIAVVKSAGTAAARDVSGKLAETDRNVANIVTRLDNLDQTANTLAQTVTGANAQRDSRRDTAARLAMRITALETGLAAIGKTRLAAAALLVARLEDAVRAGTPFVDDLMVLRALAPDLKTLGALAPFAEHGVPSRDALSAGFTAVSGKMDTLRSAATGTLMDRLVARAGAIVTVRRGDAMVVGSKPLGSVGKIAARLRAGDLRGAQEAGRRLDAPVRKIAQSWLDELAMAVSADAALREMKAWVRASLAGEQKTAHDGNKKAE